MADSIQQTLEKIRQFRDERDWMQFHGHREMAMSVMIEAAELLEHFQWKSQAEIDEYVKTHKDHIADEVADVAMYLFELADNMGVDLLDVMEKKLEKNAKKYPIEKAKGKHEKYTKL